MQRFEVMLKVQGATPTINHSDALNTFYEAFTLSGSERPVADDVYFYDLDIYDSGDNGDYTIKVLLESDRSQDEIAESMQFGFNTDRVSTCTFSQIQVAH